MTQEEAKLVADMVSENLRAGHACRFHEDEAAVVHGFGRALKEHKAGEKELFVIIQIGKNVTDFVERAGRAILWAVIVAGVGLLFYGIMPMKGWR